MPNSKHLDVVQPLLPVLWPPNGLKENRYYAYLYARVHPCTFTHTRARTHINRIIFVNMEYVSSQE